MKTKFLMAEEVRQELNNKASILGCFPDDVVVMTGKRPENAPAEIPDGIDRLAFLINVSDLPKGVHKFRGVIIDPSGEPYNPEMNLGEELIKEGHSHSLIIQLKPFIIKKRGIFHFNLYVDDSLSSFPFEIR